MKSSWRKIARPIIAEVLRQTEDPKERKKILREAYPFGARQYHPYKIWLDEIKRQTGKKDKKRQIQKNPAQLKLL